MNALNFIFLSFAIFLFFGSAHSQNPCEFGWEPYKDEKCLKIFEETGLSNYADAEAFCAIQDNANLISIGTQEKQTYLENLFKTNDIADYIWLGLKFEDGAYKWTDGTKYQYTNWAPGNPKNDSDHCVQIQTDDFEFGKWSVVVCTKKNLVLCEKNQPWSLPYLQGVVLNLIRNPVPIGFIYVQLPKEKSPDEIWPLVTWEDVSSDYGSLFFRVDGKNSSAFGVVQEQASPRLINVQTRIETSQGDLQKTLTLSPNNQYSKFISTAHASCDNVGCYRGLSFKESADEVRPRNMAVRIWKRIG